MYNLYFSTNGNRHLWPVFLGSLSWRNTSPDFSPTKFFAGRDTGHEAVVIYRSLRYLQMLGNEAAADKSV
ncbi:MAG: hypothetical protein ACI8ZB_004654, partial [Desulforhopalus sp.]